MGSQEPEEPQSSPIEANDLAWIDWLQNQQKTGQRLFKLDVTFDSTGTTASADVWLEYFDTRVVSRLNKSLGFRPRKNKGSSGVVNASAREFEFDVKSAGYRGTDWRCPAHVHSIVVVPARFAPRMISNRVKTDLEALQRVSSVHIEPVLNEPAAGRTLKNAYFYVRKGKTFRPLY